MVRSMAVSQSSLAVYIGGVFGLASYQEPSGLRILLSPTASASVYGSVASLAVADYASSCVYVAGALTEASSGRKARLVRRCQTAGAHPEFEIASEEEDSRSVVMVLQPAA